LGVPHPHLFKTGSKYLRRAMSEWERISNPQLRSRDWCVYMLRALESEPHLALEFLRATHGHRDVPGFAVDNSLELISTI